MQPAPPAAYAAPYGTPGAYAPVPRTNTLAIVAFVLAFFVSLAAVICGHIALSQIKRTGEGGRGLALAAVIIGYVGIGFAVIYVLFIVVVVIAGAASGGYSGSGY